jgi:hypothetical protein
MFTPSASSRRHGILLKAIGTLQLGLCVYLLPLFLFGFVYGGASAFPTAFSAGLWFFAYGIGSAIALFWRGIRWRAALELVWQAVLMALLGVATGPRLAGGFDPEGSPAVVLVPFILLASIIYLGQTVATDIRTLVARDPAGARRLARSAIVPLLLLATAVGAYLYSWNSVRGLTWRLGSSDRDTSCMSARRLGRKGPAAARALPAFLPMLEKNWCSTIGEAADDPMDDIERIGGLDAVLSVMRAGGPRGRSAAALYVRLNAHRHPARWTEVRPAFRMGLQDREPIIRSATLALIEQAGSIAADLVPEVRPLLADDSSEVRARARAVRFRFGER